MIYIQNGITEIKNNYSKNNHKICICCIENFYFYFYQIRKAEKKKKKYNISAHKSNKKNILINIIKN